MVRKQVYIENRQENLLKRLSKELKVSEAELIRRGIDASLRVEIEPVRDPSAWQEIRKAALARPAGKAKKRRWTRDEVYDRGKRSD